MKQNSSCIVTMHYYSVLIQLISLTILYCALLYNDFQNNNASIVTLKDTNTIQKIQELVLDTVKDDKDIGMKSIHIWYNNVQTDLKENIDLIDQHVHSKLNNLYPGYKVQVIPHMTEINISGKKKDNSDLVFFTRHIDAPFGMTPCKILRVLVGINGRLDTQTIFQNTDVIVDKGKAVIFDYDRSAHYVQKLEDPIDNQDNSLRITLKLQYALFKNDNFNNWCVNLHEKWAVYSRKMLEGNQQQISLATRIGILVTYISTYMHLVVLVAIVLLVAINFNRNLRIFPVLYYVIIFFILLYYLSVVGFIVFMT